MHMFSLNAYRILVSTITLLIAIDYRTYSIALGVGDE